MFDLNRSTESVDLSLLNTSASDDSKSIMDASHSNELTRKYFNNLAQDNLTSFSTNSLPVSLSTSRLNTSSLTSTSLSSSSINLVYQLTTAVNDLAIDTLLTNSTPTLVTNPSNGSSFNDTSSQICMVINETYNECYDEKEFNAVISEYIYPAHYEFVMIALHIIVFIVGLIGNALVCISVYRNHSMRNVVNYFIVNLAVADFLVILICLPPTVLWDVTETWWLGNTMCKTVLYFQGVSVFVSILTLTFISIDRWYAICHPLRFKCTTAKARIVIALIWFTSLVAMLPEAVSLHIVPRFLPDTIYLTDCVSSWDNATQQIYQLMIVSFLFIIPFLLMSVAYYQIAKVLWIRHIPGSAERSSSPTANSESRRSSSQINRSFKNLNPNKNLCIKCLFYLCCCNRTRSRSDRQFNNNRIRMNRQITELTSQPQSPSTSFSQHNKMSFELNGGIKASNINNHNNNNNSPLDGSLQCTPLDTPSGTQSPTHQNVKQQNNSPQSINDEASQTNDLSNLETVIEANSSSRLPNNIKNNNLKFRNENQEKEVVKEEDESQVEFLNNNNANYRNEINLSNLSANLRNNLNNLSSNQAKENNKQNFTTTPSAAKSSNIFQTALNKVIRLDSSSKNKNQTNGISLADNYERQDINKTELTTLSNGQIEFQTTSFIRSRSTRARTIEEKNSRLSTPVQTLNTNQSSFKRIRRMTLPGNRLSKYVSANRAESRVNCEGHIQSRRKAAKMLIAVVVMFGICYLPVHLINILRNTIGLSQNDFTTVASLVSHWLCYANSALNPIIYNVMSGKFRREFKNAFTCMCFRTQQQSTICRNSQHQTTRILNRQPVGNRVRANPQLLLASEPTSQNFTANNVNAGTYLLNTTSTRPTNKHTASIGNNNVLISQVEMPASRIE